MAMMDPYVIIVEFLKNESKNGFKIRRENWAELKVQLQAFTKNPVEKRVFDYFDFIAWAQSKLTGKSFAECLRDQ